MVDFVLNQLDLHWGSSTEKQKTIRNHGTCKSNRLSTHDKILLEELKIFQTEQIQWDLVLQDYKKKSSLFQDFCLRTDM